MFDGLNPTVVRFLLPVIVFLIWATVSAMVLAVVIRSATNAPADAHDRRDDDAGEHDPGEQDAADAPLTGDTPHDWRDRFPPP